MDEVGSSLEHSKSPSMAVVPFLFMPDGTLDSGMRSTLLSPQNVPQLKELSLILWQFLPDVATEGHL